MTSTDTPARFGMHTEAGDDVVAAVLRDALLRGDWPETVTAEAVYGYVSHLVLASGYLRGESFDEVRSVAVREAIIDMVETLTGL